MRNFRPHLSSGVIAVTLHLFILGAWASTYSGGSVDDGKYGIEVGLGTLGEAGTDETSVPVEPEISEPEPEPVPTPVPEVVEEIPEPVELDEQSVPVETPVPVVEESHLVAFEEATEREVVPQVRPATQRSTGIGSDSTRGGEQGARVDYIRQVNGLLQAATYYPRRSRTRGEEGVTVVLIVVRRDGHVAKSTVTRQSGSQLLDDTMQQIVENASPFPPFPQTISANELSFSVSTRWSLIK